MEVESENFDENKHYSKVQITAEKAQIGGIFWDYLHDIIMNYVLDDLSQVLLWVRLHIYP